MDTVYHIPAMQEETLQGLITNKNGIYVDVTLGGGGHSRAILERLGTNGRLFSFDQDKEAIANALQEKEMPCSRWELVHGNFRYLQNFMDYYGVEQVDGVLADLGVSFHHFDTPERGFSFRFDGPLDMRMNQQGGRTAADIVNSHDEESLARVLYMYGEMKNARQVARRIVKARATTPITTVEQFVEVCQVQKKDLAQLFQALRIEVNDEMGALREMLEGALQLLKPGGRLAILTYHSLEDRMVKNFLRAGNIEGTIEKDFYGNILTPFRVLEKGRQPSPEEVERNPRSRSARLRIGEKK
ncbi:MAG: 16S rRNA (cytosine(1402)-N(4))-methyltransferase RsmH [Paludibacteraceae bacterium]|nr:16S rRNA (cytosine(1402)-N(4))-methyltransferase RsmH [Paludibacteraceae bacterium]